MLPPKITLDHLPSPTTGPRSAGPPRSPDGLSLPSVISPPGSPMSFSSGFAPPSPTLAAPADRPKKTNPFVDLIETEKVYVDTLSGIIRVCAHNILNTLRFAEICAESSFGMVEVKPSSERTRRHVSFCGSCLQGKQIFLLKTKGDWPQPFLASSHWRFADEMGSFLLIVPVPISAQRLHNQVDQLVAPYGSYCTSYLTGFDTWEPIKSNQRLPGVLSTFSSSNPPPSSGPEVWTLDTLLSLPRSRIRYYQKLYGRLLKNSAPGRSTDKKLVEANEKLERLLTTAEERSSIPLPGSDQVIETTDEVVIDTRDRPEPPSKTISDSTNDQERPDSNGLSLSDKKTIAHREPEIRTSVDSSTRGSVLSSRCVHLRVVNIDAKQLSVKHLLAKHHFRQTDARLQGHYRCHYPILSVVLLWNGVAISLL